MNNKVIYPVFLTLALALIIPANVLAQAQPPQNFKVFVSVDNQIYQVNLKGTQIKIQNIIQVSERSDLAITTNSIKKDTIQKVTAVDQLGNVHTLQKDGVGLYTLLGLKTGIYLLNIQVNVPNKTYQTVLVLLGNGAKPLVFN